MMQYYISLLTNISTPPPLFLLDNILFFIKNIIIREIYVGNLYQ